MQSEISGLNHIVKPTLEDQVLLSSLEKTQVEHISLFYEYFQRDEVSMCYGNSWLYIIQASRYFGVGYHFHNEKMLVSIGMHREHFVLIRPIGILDHDFIALVEELYNLSNKPVFIKKLFPEQTQLLCENENFRIVNADIPEHLYWDEGIFADDDTFPEVILSIKVLLALDLSPSEWFRFYKRQIVRVDYDLDKIKRAYKTFRWAVSRYQEEEDPVKVFQYNVKRKEEVKDFIRKYFPEDAENLQAYENMLSFNPSENRNILSYVAYDQAGSVVGYFCAERLDEKSAGIYAELALNSKTGLPEYLSTRFYSKLLSKGIEFINLGGSELFGLHKYKIKFAPIEERYMDMLVYEKG